jgi:transcriptional regulator with XRE-family HTH domain
MDDLKSIVSKNILHLRTNRKMTQLELGEALSYSDKAVSKWERGEAIPDAYILKRIGEIFNVSVDYLLSEHDEKELRAAKFHNVDRRVITIISFLGIWTLAIIAFAVLYFIGITQWLVFVYVLPASLVLLTVFAAVWGSTKAEIISCISLVVWSVLAAIYLTFLEYNFWLLFVIGIPAQVIILLSFRVKVIPKR